MEKEEGKEAVTSPAGSVMNDTPIPTQEEKEEAGLEVVVQEQQQEEEIPEQEVQEENGVVSGSATKMFTQSQVDEIAGKTRKEAEMRVKKKVFGRYGVSSEEELDDLFSNAQKYDTLKEQYDEEAKAWKEGQEDREKKYRELSEEVALLRSGIDEDRFEDAVLILRGKGLDVTLENIEKELATHQEWKKQSEAIPENAKFQKKQPQNNTRLAVLGNNSADTPVPELSERDIALKKLFKV